MAPKSKGEAPARSNRFRMIVIDSDLSDSAIANLTQAINHALRPQLSPAPQPRAALPAANHASGNGDMQDAGDTEVIEHEGEEPPEETVAPVVRAAAKTPRQYYKPKVLKDFELTDGRDVSFEAFANEKAQTADTKRYLMIAAWCHDHADTPQVTADHVYTCYRSMGWTLDAKNPNQPFFDLQRNGWGEIKKSKFEINHLGVGQVEKMTASAE